MLNKLNLYNKKLKICSNDPLTGYSRDGYCKPINGDFGNHLVCAKMNEKFLDSTAKQGNNLRSVVKSGDKWCICQNRYLEAVKAGSAPKVVISATSNKVRPDIKKIITKKNKKKQKGGNLLPKLREIEKKTKRHHYKLYDPPNKRRLAIDEGINQKQNRTQKAKRHAAKMKKARFNVLRLYRKNKDKKGCKNLTQDMKYIDKKYGLGSTKKICGGKSKIKTAIAFFSGGCFWGIQKQFNKIIGVISTDVGYMGGKIKNPTYEIVSQGKTNYAETVRVKYNKNLISFKQLIDNFFKMHDPSSLNKQGLDIGSQYRSIVFYNNKNEKEIYLKFLNQLINRNKIVTQLLSSKNYKFYKAEEYHQNYLDKIGGKKIYKKTKKQQFLYNPDNPKLSFDVYIDKNPEDTITIKYTTCDDIKNTIKKLERLYKTKKYPHKRIWQVGMIMKVRMHAMLKHKKTRYKKAKNVKARYDLANRYFKFLKTRTKKSTFKERKKMIFN